MKSPILYIFFFIFFLFSCKQTEEPLQLTNVYIESATINGISVYNGGSVYNTPVDSVVIHLTFSSTIDKNKLNASKLYISNGVDTAFTFIEDTASRKISFRINKTLSYYNVYTLYIVDGENFGVKITDPYQYSFTTQLDSTPKFPVISDDSLLTLVQKKTFSYFWDYGHPVSGLARERYGSGETVTSGGSGFGVMTIPVAIERGFITRNEGFERLNKIVNFLNTTADRFHGAFPHWMNGTTGKVQPFTTKDNGADLVETAFLIEGLLTVQQYFKNGNTAEKNMCDTIQKIWEDVEWTWFQQNGQQKLYWHWSPSYNWDMNMPVTGWNEGLIIYVLAASSPTYPIAKSVITSYSIHYTKLYDFSKTVNKNFTGTGHPVTTGI